MKHIISVLFSLLLVGTAYADGGTDSELMGSGIHPEAARLLGESRATGLSAAGTSQGTATLLKATVNVFTTVTTASAEGVKLPTKTNIPRDDITVVNQGAGIMQVYPPTGGAINNAGTNIPIAVAPGYSAVFRRISSTGWSGIIEGADANQGYFTSAGLIFPSRGQSIQHTVYLVTPLASPTIGSNIVLPGYNVFPPTPTANAAAILEPSTGSNTTPVPGQCMEFYNPGAATVRVKAGGGATMNGATAGGYVAVATLTSGKCCATSTSNYACVLHTNPTPAGP